MISMKPDVVVHEVGEDLMFIVLACDGIWDVLGMDFLIDGQISSFCLRQHEAALLTLIISHKLFVKLLKNTFLGMPKVRAWSIFTLPMP